MGERRPGAVIVENVPGFATVNDGRDFALVVEVLESFGLTVNSTVVNASTFLPQSRARVFLFGAHGEQPLLPEVLGATFGCVPLGGWQHRRRWLCSACPVWWVVAC